VSSRYSNTLRVEDPLRLPRLGSSTFSALLSEISFKRSYFALGLFLLSLFILQWLLGLSWQWLENLHNSEIYKQVTGYALFGYLLLQWRLAHWRWRGCLGGNSLSQLRAHKLYGVMLPLVFYFHATSLGYGYLFLLGLSMLLVHLLGLLNLEVVKWKSGLTYSIWLICHVSIATLVLGLSVYHIYVIYAYS